MALRRIEALKEIKRLQQEDVDINPVVVEGRKIARTFWGNAWCEHLESFSDFSNRLPRGRSYLRNGLVCHLDIARGEVTALVSGSELYKVSINIKTLPRKKWAALKKRCAGQIGSILELLQGKLSDNVLSVVTDRKTGLFPLRREINLDCTCPDFAVMCKHVAAVLYGIGARLDEEPELLFRLRGVDYEELLDTGVDATSGAVTTKSRRRRIADDALAEVFGIDVSDEDVPVVKKRSSSGRKAERETQQSPGAGAESRTAKRTQRAGKKRTRSHETSAGTKRTSSGTSGLRTITGKAVAELRAEFGMTPGEFARLLGVSAPTIGNWEKKQTGLNLQSRTLKALRAASTLTKQQAWRKMKNIR